MSEMPWVRFFPSDWLAGTRGMSAAETGIYITLVATMYERGEPVPEDHSRLARLCGAPVSTFRKTLETLIEEGKILRVEAGLWNKRVGEESTIRAEKSEAAANAATARWSKKGNKNKSSDNANAMRTQCDGNANQKPEARSQKEAASQLSRGVDLVDRLCDAAGIRGNIPQGLAFAGEIIGLIQAGYDLEADILPAIKARPNPKARTWAYFVPQIRDAVERRSAAASVKAPERKAVDWPARIKYFQQEDHWPPGWGPKPGEVGCEAPANLLGRVAA